MKANRYQAIFQQTAIAIQIYDRTGKCVEVNDAWEELFHSRKADLAEYNVFEDPQVKANGVYDCFMRAFGGEVVHVPPTYYDPTASGKTGRPRWLESIFSPVKDNQGEVVEVAIIFSDVTELRRSQDKMRAILHNVPEGILVQDVHHKVVLANETAARMAGLNSVDDWESKDALIDFHDYLTEDDKPYPLEELPGWKVLRGEGDVLNTIIKFRNKKTGEVRTSEVSSRAVYDEKGRPYLAVSAFRDITEKLRIDTQLKEALASQGLFFSVASHELRTPLTALKLNARLMNLTYPNVSLEGLEKIDRQVGKLSRLVDEMLDMSRLANGKLELLRKDVDLSRLIRDVLSEMSEQLKLANITLTTSILGDIKGHWDPERIEQVMENLITNAIRYAPDQPLFVGLTMENGKARIEVCDQGAGIPPEDIDKIFNRFARSRSFGERSGLGLGLYIVKEIITLHGGEISVSNLNTGGARFIIDLPLR